MDEKEFKECASRLEQIGKVIEKVPSEVRQQAFELVKGYVTRDRSGSFPDAKVRAAEVSGSAGTREEFFANFEHEKPDRNARLIAAYLYREFGTDAFSLNEVREVADHVGLTIPKRLDMTFLQAKDKSKKLFMRAGTGMFMPTVYGETFLKATYSIKKGTKKRAKEAE